ncbi:DUF1365 domain-containing protein [Fuerstiella marisgermanici]|uniref:DUF1365 domain-containing protein n=1 Tax=Fuerstiella marisgermanici TaxID=1891926 RepID=A0A1P8WA18_9PLAN|nr:DUF1365 domain-containing protein [Fuerstiella marisgermanici]APZ90905.1 hypothetical protein Fuma_00489 [Fuerstiella marisgermanici]
MHSCIYEGTVRHRRFHEKHHEFQNRLFLMYLDLDELSTVFKGRWFWSTSRPALARFRRDQYLGEAEKSLPDCVRDLVQQKTGYRPEGPVRLLTSLRYFGYLINPVSFYFCYNGMGDHVEAIVAEVTNTPWGERHCYVIDSRSATDQTSTSNAIRATNAKQFHVSPFLSMGMTYHWTIRPPGDHLSIHVENRAESERAFDASLSLRRREITGLNLARALVRFPFMTGQIAASIYWQALRLWWKNVTFYPHPAKSLAADAMKTTQTIVGTGRSK